MAATDYFQTEHLRQELTSHATKGAGATILAQLSCYIIQTIGTIILARLLSPEDFGLIAMVAAFSLLLQNFGVNGFTEAVIQKEKINHQQLSTLFGINLVITFLLTIGLIAISPAIAAFYGEPRLRPITIALSLSIILSALSTHHMALLKRNLLFYRTSAIEVAASFFSISFAIALAFRGWGYWSLVARQLLLSLITSIGAWKLCRWRPGRPAAGSGVKSMLYFAFNTYGNFCISYVQKNIDKVLIGRFLGSLPLGHYDRATNLSSMLPNQLTIPLTNVALATLSRLADEPEQYRYYFAKVLSLLAFAAFPLSMILTLTGRDLIHLVLGPQWHQAGEIFSVLGLAIGMIVLYGTHGWLHLSFGRADRWMRWSSAALLVTVIFFIMGLPYGPVGVAVAYTVSYYVLIIPALWYAGKPCGIKVSLFISAIWKYFLAALAAGLSIWLLLYALEPNATIFSALPLLARIVVVSICYISLYIILVIVFHRSTEPLKKFIAVLDEMIPGRRR